MSKPPTTLIDRPAYRDWAVWLAGLATVKNLWDVVDIYLLQPGIWDTLGTRGAVTALVVELLFVSMLATFVGVVVTTLRRSARKWLFRRHLHRNVEFLTPVTPRSDTRGAVDSLRDFSTSARPAKTASTRSA